MRQNQPSCRRLYPPMTHFSHSLYFFYLIFLLQTTQTNLVQSAHGHAYSNSNERQVKRLRQKYNDADKEYMQHAASIYGNVVMVDPVFSWFYPVKQSTPQPSFNSSLFPVTMETYRSLLPNYSFFHLFHSPFLTSALATSYCL